MMRCEQPSVYPKANTRNLEFPFMPPRPRPMRCLTVRQPHAWGLISGEKRVENRSRQVHFRGPLAIHAGLGRADLAPANRRLYPGLPPDEELAFGMVIGVVEVVDCVPIAEAAGLPYAEGPWCWIIGDPRPVEPFPWRGSLGIFEVPEHLLVPLALRS